MSVQLQHHTTSGARLLAVKEVYDVPGILKTELSERLRATTGLSGSTVADVLHELELEGHLASAEHESHEAYRPARGR